MNALTADKSSLAELADNPKVAASPNSRDVETQDCRKRLIDAAIQIFAVKGYDSASTREICRLAGANVAAIHYHFGDKATLYRQIFRGPDGIGQFPVEFEDLQIPLRDALVVFYRHIMSFIVAPTQAQQFRLVFIREQLQPTGLLDGQADAMRPHHERLMRFLGARLNVADAADLPLVHLAFSLVGLATVLFIQRAEIQGLAPELLRDEAAVAATVERLADAGVALINAEAVRRGKS